MKRGEKKLIKRITDMMFRSLQFSISNKLVLGDFIIEHAKLVNNPYIFDTYIIKIVRAKNGEVCVNSRIAVIIKNKKYEVERIIFNPNYEGLCGKRKLIEEIKKSCRF